MCACIYVCMCMQVMHVCAVYHFGGLFRRNSQCRDGCSGKSEKRGTDIQSKHSITTSFILLGQSIHINKLLGKYAKKTHISFSHSTNKQHQKLSDSKIGSYLTPSICPLHISRGSSAHLITMSQSGHHLEYCQLQCRSQGRKLCRDLFSKLKAPHQSGIRYYHS